MQHSTNGNEWTDISSQPANGHSDDVRSYSYVHSNPASGANYYRILQSDLDEKISYSEIRIVKFDSPASSFAVIENPVNNRVLKVRLNAAMELSFYSADGKLLWKKSFNTGVQDIEVPTSC